MDSLKIPDEDQIKAMLNGTVYQLASEYGEDASRYDLRKYLTITRQKLVDFLTSHPDEAKTYFEKYKEIPATHDVEKMWKEGGEYVVASMDHGVPRDVTRFRTLAEAVAEHVLVGYGMY